MNKHHTYKTIIESKLAQIPGPDADLLWNDMHSVLDREMPQKKERRRFIAWFLSGKGLFLMIFSSLVITGSSLVLLSRKGDIAGATEKKSSQLLNKFIENNAKRSLQKNENGLTIIGEKNQSTDQGISTKTGLINCVDHMVNDNTILRQTKTRPEPQASTTQLIQQANTNSNRRRNSRVGLADLNAIHQYIHTTPNPNKEKLSLTQLPHATKKMNTTRNSESGFYAGIMFGADLSSVQLQPAKNGATAGFIIGYSINQKWSIESGLLWDTKRVYDDGTYFNPPGYTPTNGVAIVAVNGKSRLHEWPVNIKYSIKSGDHSFFATTGVSSYFMTAENYDYEYTLNNQPGGHNYLSYKKETKDWFGVMNFSMGYSHNIGNNGSLRIEPYLKLPISNIGVANMPIMSTGFNIGITKPIRR